MDEQQEAGRAFGHIYETDAWEGGSGIGSAPDATAPYRALLQRVLSATDVHSVVDVGCGDWQLGSLVDWTGTSYTGVDVVDDVVRRNAERHGRSGVEFRTADARRDPLPAADLLLVKDVLQHWPTSDVAAFLTAVVPRYRYALLTNDLASAHWQGPQNADVQLGEWRTLDLEAAPFDRPAAWRWDFDVRGEWTKRVLLYRRSRAAALRPGSLLRTLRG